MLKLVETTPEVSRAAAATAFYYAWQASAGSVGDLCGMDVACKLLNSRLLGSWFYLVKPLISPIAARLIVYSNNMPLSWSVASLTKDGQQDDDTEDCIVQCQIR